MLTGHQQSTRHVRRHGVILNTCVDGRPVFTASIYSRTAGKIAFYLRPVYIRIGTPVISTDICKLNDFSRSKEVSLHWKSGNTAEMVQDRDVDH